MPIQLDHAFVASNNVSKSAALLASLLDVPYEKLGAAYAVYINDGLTLEFINTDRDIQSQHLCFRVSEEDFSHILARIQSSGITYSSEPGGDDMQVNTRYGGRILYWKEPDGHQWEILTVSYARPD